MLQQQLLAASKLDAAQASIQSGEDGVREGVAMLLTAISEYECNQDSGGVNGSQVLGAAMRRLTEDPYLTLGVDPAADEGTIKKAYRKLALRYHPDKNKATSTLFQAVQGAHDILIEPNKRAEYDVKRKRQQEALNRLRKHPKGSAAGTPANNAGAASPGGARQPTAAGASPSGGESATRGSSPYAAGGRAAAGSTAGAGGGSSKKSSAASGTSARGEPAAASGDEKVRQFNKRFYEEFRREAQKQDKSKASSKRTSAAAAGTSKHQPPSRPKMRSTNRTESTVTLEWHCAGLPSTTAFELQWRQRGRTASEWVTSPTLVVGKSCRKKNLAPCTCYEFRVRAASAWGWSGYCDPVMVVTLPSTGGGGADAGSGGAGGESASTSPPRQKVSGFQSDGIGGSAAEKAKAQVEEARHRRSQTQAGHAKPSVQFRSSSIAGTEDGGGSGGGGAAPPGMEKTNSWYWRRMSRAAAQEGKEAATSSAEGGGKEKAQRRRTMHAQGTPSEGAWVCVVCKRPNEPTSNSCWVCYTTRSYQPVNLDRIRTENETPGRREGSVGGGGNPLGSGRRASIGSRPRSPSTTPTEGNTGKQSPTAGKGGSNTTNNGAAATDDSGVRVSEKVPSIRVYSVPTQPEPAGDGIRVSASDANPSSGAAGNAAAGEEGTKDPADVWEFTEGDLDNVGGGATTYGSDDEWSYASGTGGLDTKSDPGDADRYRRRRSSTGGAAAQRRRSSQAGATTNVGGGDGDNDDDATPKRYLNGRITKLHNVRAEPIREAKVVGYLIATKEVEVLAEVGDWYKVRWHKRAKEKARQDPPSSSSSPSSSQSKDTAASESTPAEGNGGGSEGEKRNEEGEAEKPDDASEERKEKGTGWCVTRDKKHQYIVTVGAEETDPDATRRPSSAKSNRKKSAAGRRRSSVTGGRASRGGLDDSGGGGGEGGGGVFGEAADEGECWHELKDEDGSVYYFNATSGMSQWEPPMWLDEIDPTTGAVYYVNTFTGDPQWERPEEFIPIVRENPYATTPEQDFIKSVLSPKRSKGPKSFHEAMHKAAQTGSAQHLNTVTEGVAGGGRETAENASAA
ncbi:Heat shock protein 40 like protein/ DnaJ domain containing protein [Ectocarpus siliculosus]|uniref:Heat shock protein 40 like protein/ DnaJ domain containing protein n=1 Tax=Ectocarpus siliculosus TaxID=2880 RepID=D7G3I7_ECTSI|nr:Heat shock protein 40 like protein/ DnaJ domain containing protein [Ectocarpus siliculosus]|eukprot:CBJ26985.1 Heat shock protein 40 like protein/ DnaJ domain containing protein [Ectocarpus siliculosus]